MQPWLGVTRRICAREVNPCPPKNARRIGRRQIAARAGRIRDERIARATKALNGKKKAGAQGSGHKHAQGLGFEGFGLVSAFPGEKTVFGGAAKVAERSGREVDRAQEIKGFDDAGRFELESAADTALNFGLGDGVGAERVHEDRNGLGNADGIGQLDFTTTGKTGGHDVFGHIARHVAGGTIDFGGILAGERATTMTAHATVGVDDDFTAGQTTVTLRTTDDETARRVDVEFGVFVDEFLGNRLFDDELGDAFVEVFFGHVGTVLGGNDDGINAFDLAALVTHGHLAFAVGTQEIEFAGIADLGETTREGMGVHDRGRHEFRGLVTRIAKHQALVAGPLFGHHAFVGIDALTDVRALRFDGNHDAAGLVVKPLERAVVANFLDGIAGNFGNIDPRRGGNFTGNNDDTRFEHRLARHVTRFILFQNGVQNGIADLICHFVGMTFGDGFACKKNLSFFHFQYALPDRLKSSDLITAKPFRRHIGGRFYLKAENVSNNYLYKSIKAICEKPTHKVFLCGGTRPPTPPRIAKGPRGDAAQPFRNSWACEAWCVVFGLAFLWV